MGEELFVSIAMVSLGRIGLELAEEFGKCSRRFWYMDIDGGVFCDGL